jgi:hypothetical protein
MAASFGRMYNSLKRIYTPSRIFLNVVILVAYYYIFNFIIALQEHGAVIIVFPVFILYLLIITSSIAMTIGIYSIRNSKNNEAKYSSTSIGAATTLIGTVIGGCNCTAPLLFGLTALGVNVVEITSLINFISANQITIFFVMIAINLILIFYYLDRFSTPRCMTKSPRKR